MKKQALHVITWKEDKLFVAKFLELELASQGKTKDQAVDNLKEALDLYLEGEKTGSIKFSPVDNVSTQTVILS